MASIPDNPIVISGTGYRIQDSSFKGIGPLLGFGANYHISSNISIIAKLNIAFLAGNINSQENDFTSLIISTSNGTISGSASSQIKSIRHCISPEVDTKLALSYLYRLNQSNNSSLTFQIGWWFSNYFNSINKVSIDTTVIKQSGIAFNGPFIEFSYHI